jgi:predicted nuclease of predicted toxin-antitoxin system
VIRFLLDQGIPHSAVARLQDRGCAARHVADIGLERASDLDILQAARNEGECVVTLDADFHSRPAVSGAESPSLVRIRWEGLRSADIAALIARVIQQAAIQLERGAIVSVTERSIRVHRLPVGRHVGPTGIQER